MFVAWIYTPFGASHRFWCHKRLIAWHGECKALMALGFPWLFHMKH